MKRQWVIPNSLETRLKRATRAAVVAASFAVGVGGCSVGATAPAAYKVANEARLNAVAPWLTEYKADHPDRRERIEDVVASWRIEVAAQRGAVAPAR